METLITFKTAKLAKDKGFDIYQKNVYVETLEHTLEMGRGGDCTFPAHEPRILKNRGFDKWHIVHCQAPSQSVLQKWLREEYNIRIFCTFETIDDSETAWVWDIVKDNIEGNGRKKDTWDFYDRWDSFSYMMWWKDYEEAMEEGLFQALNLI